MRRQFLRGSLRRRRRRPIATPRSRLRSPLVRDPHGHGAQSIVESGLRTDRPPAVQENLQRAPHGNPTADRETLPQQLAQPLALHSARDEIAQSDSRDQKRQPDHQADPPDAEQLAQPAPRDLRAVREKLVDGVAQSRGLVGKARGPVLTDQQRQRRTARGFARPAYY